MPNGSVTFGLEEATTMFPAPTWEAATNGEGIAEIQPTVGLVPGPVRLPLYYRWGVLQNSAGGCSQCLHLGETSANGTIVARE